MKTLFSGSALAQAMLGVVVVLSNAPAVASHIGESATVDQEVVSANNEIINGLSQWEKAPASAREARAAQLTAAALRRQERMVALLQKNPKVAAARMMPAALRNRLPAQAADLVEREVNEQGTVFASVSDDFARGVSKSQFKFRSNAGGAPLNLYLADGDDGNAVLSKWAGKRLRLNAMRVGEHLAILDRKNVQLEAAGATGTSTSTSTGTIAAATTAVQGDQKTLSILVNFSDKAISCTAADVQGRLFGATGATVNANYRESSRGLVSFSGQAIGPYTINYTSTGTCDYGAWGTAAEAAARAAGIDPSQYTRVNYVTPPNSTCGWAGLAYMPGNQSWVQSCGTTAVYSHELGHNLSLNHASTPTSEYGDYSDPMGISSASRLPDHNGANRTMAGWMPAGTVADVSAGGSYALTSLSNITSTGTPQVLRIPKPDTAETYYVSLRSALGLDATLPTQFVDAVSVHRSTGTLPAKTILMQVLAAGQSFNDATNGITVTNQGVSNGVATVGVTLSGGVCVHTAPAVSVSPASQTGASGAAKNYTVSVTNNNSTACASSSFALAQVLPSGFTGSFSVASLSLAAGATGTATWTVISPAAAVDGSYNLDVNATNSAIASDTITAHASYVVYNNTAPTLTITSPSQTSLTTPTYSLRTNLALSATASDASGIKAVEFYGDGMLLARDTLSPYTANWNLRKVGRGIHTVKVRAIDNTGLVTERSVTIAVN